MSDPKDPRSPLPPNSRSRRNPPRHAKLSPMQRQIPLLQARPALGPPPISSPSALIGCSRSGARAAWASSGSREVLGPEDLHTLQTASDLASSLMDLKRNPKYAEIVARAKQLAGAAPQH